ncbi:MAG: gliding motility-associated C-terminal domain-containing protein [Bacteroidetes bacterium]|nr:gliding motility-associated C-terminal domain-containing protein [Bacteroidota bacterium]
MNLLGLYNVALSQHTDRPISLNLGMLKEFIPNQGQWNSEILYRSQSSDLDVHVTSKGINYFFYDPKQIEQLASHVKVRDKCLIDSLLQMHLISLEFINSNTSDIQTESSQEHYYNYFLGKEPSHWKGNIYPCKTLHYKNLFDGIDLKTNINRTGSISYDYYLKPNSDVENLKFKVNGADRVIVEYGELYIHYSFGYFKESKPYAYQMIDGKKHEIEVSYKIYADNTIGFDISNEYNKNYELIIDPDLVFATYSGSSVDNFGYSATYDEAGNLYSGGIALAISPSVDPNGKYPTTPGAFQSKWMDGSSTTVFVPGTGNYSIPPCDISISKYSADGKTLVFATLMGGSGNEYPHSLVVDKQNHLVVFGSSTSPDYPVKKFSFDTLYHGKHDIVLSKLSIAGDSLIGSTYIGGNDEDGKNQATGLLYFYADDFRGDVICDDDGNVFVASCSSSNNFPTTTGAFNRNYKGLQDGIVFKLNNDLSNLIWSTYIGGSMQDALYSIDFDSKKNIYLSGGTISNDMFTHNTAYKKSHSNTDLTDGYIAILSPDGKTISNATYFGKSKYDQIYFLELDTKNSPDIWVIGQTEDDYVSSIGTYNNKNGKLFIAKFDSSLNNLNLLTTIGSGRAKPDLTINAFLVDDCKRIYFSGWGGTELSSGDPSGLTVTEDAFKKTNDDGEFYLMMLDKNASGLLYATYFGGSQTNDHVDGGTSRFDKKGIVYQSVCASCPNNNTTHHIADFPVTSGAYSVNNPSPRCSNAVFKFDFRIKKAQFDFSVDSCSNIIKYKNKTAGAISFMWIFPNGDTSYLENPIKTFKRGELKNYKVMMIVEYGTACADTALLNINYNDSLEALKFPNVFTPNGDLKNDYFKLDGNISPCYDGEIIIYNRWGNMVYESKSINFAWDGTDGNGSNLSDGVYFYIVRVNDIKGNNTNRGTVTLIR